MNLETTLTGTVSEENLEVLASIKRDSSRKVLVVIGQIVFVEKILRAVQVLAMATLDNKWIFILSDWRKASDLDEGSKDIISMSNMLLLESAHNQNCKAIRFHCIQGLLFELIHQALLKVLPEKQSLRPFQIKNRLLSTIRVSIKVSFTKGFTLSFCLEKYRLASSNFTANSCGNCNHLEINSFHKHRTNDIVDDYNEIVQVNYPNLKYEIFTKNNGNWSPFKGLLLQDDDDSETNLKNRPLNIGIIHVSSRLDFKNLISLWL